MKIIDLGLLLCGVTTDEKEVILVVSQSLELVCKFILHTKKFLKAVEVIPDSN